MSQLSHYRKRDEDPESDPGTGAPGGRRRRGGDPRASYASWFIWFRKSLLVLVSLSLSSRSSIASTGFSWDSAFRSSQTF